MATTSDTTTTMTQLRTRAGMSAILVGFATFALSRVFESGFVHGLFQGATAALMVLGAFLIGSARWWRAGRHDSDPGAHWLPSRDGAIDRKDDAP